jgi:hypothetical protein
MDVIAIRDKIEWKIAQLEEARQQIQPLSEDKANGKANYDRALAINIVKLKNKLITSFNGMDCTNLPATLIVPVAKGIIYKECFDKEVSEASYKGCITTIEAIKAELNGLQSINKHLE